jgi:hypothetical protein
MGRYSNAPASEPPAPDETPHERLHRRRRNKEARDRWSRRVSELCARCCLVRLNYVHEDDREHAPEGLAYYADVPFCEFQPSGRYWR